MRRLLSARNAKRRNADEIKSQMDSDGVFRYENQFRETIAKIVDGQLTPTALNDVSRALNASGFPEIPEHDIAPGAANMAISIDDIRVFFGIPEAQGFPGYGTLMET